MQQILAVLSGDADSSGLAAAVGEGMHYFLAPNVLVTDGDQTVCDALKALSCVSAVLSDDAAKSALASTDMTTLDVSGMSNLVSTALGLNQSLDETAVMAIAGWMFGLSDQYASWKSERPRDGETWDMDGGCLPTEDSFANA
jgi:hypothetical protein